MKEKQATQHPNAKMMEQETEKRLKAFRTEVEFLHLKAQKNDLQKKLMGMAIDEHVDALINLEIAFTERRPELMPIFIEERNMFLGSVGIEEAKYLQALERDKQSRQEAMRKQVESQLPNPSEQLHAIGEQIKGQEEVLPMGKEADIPITEEPLPELQPEPELTTPEDQTT